MQYRTLAFFGLASSVLASPVPQSLISDFEPATLNRKFGIYAVGPGITNVDLRADQGQVFIGGEQSPTCEQGQRQDLATFVLYSDQRIYLYTNSNPYTQVMYVDASGMGNGNVGYSTEELDNKPRNASDEGFKIDVEGTLTFLGYSAVACPTGKEGVYSLRIPTANQRASLTGCVDVALKAFDAPYRVACQYSV